MKKIILLAMAALSVICATSCLDLYPKTAISEDVYLATAEGVEGSVLGAYAGLRNFYGEQWRYNELRSDNGRNRVIEMEGRLLDQHTSEFYIQSMTDDGLDTKLWKPAYIIINRCNQALSHIDNVTIPADKAKLSAEAMFMRCMVYFDLVRLYGDVYYVTKPIQASEALAMKTTPAATILDNIIADMEAVVSAEGLPKPSAQASSEVGRATSYAARALLAKMYLTKKNYAKVASTLKPVIDDYGIIGLVPFEKIFSIHNEMNKEMIFCVRFSGPNLGMGSSINNYFAPYGAEGIVIAGESNGYCYPSDGLLADYGIKYQWITSSGAPWIKGVNTPNRIDETSVDWSSVVDKRAKLTVSFYEKTWAFWGSKYYGCYEDNPQKYDNENDWPVFRYADILLMYAEALNETNSPQAAAPYVNAIRTRAGLPNLGADQLANAVAMHTAILKERRLEFAFENQRYFDLLREGDDYLVNTMNTQFTNEPYYFTISGSSVMPGTIKASQILLPIPFSMQILYE